ncbi:MAG: DUF2336 domain-containing protein [Alphaproteobacteria bacterium]|nr:DUF2336 domain-containing protein [Alphaproteobacteria bacterium]
MGRNVLTKGRRSAVTGTEIGTDIMGESWDQSSAAAEAPPRSPRTAELERRAAGQRAALVRALADLVMLPPRRISANERSLVADMLLEVFAHVDAPLRLEVAQRVARVRDAPPALIREIIFDEPDVAVPFIRQAESLPDVLLAECARKRQRAHREAIARRLDLSAHVADAILEHDEPEVTTLLLRRTEFTLSPHAVDRLVVQCASDPARQLALLQRPELEPAHGFLMFWWVDHERRKRILARFAIDRTVIQDSTQDLYPEVFGQAGADPLVREVLEVLDRRFRPRGANGEALSMDIVARTLRAARVGATGEALELVGRVSGVSRDLASRILRDPGGEPFAVLCKATGLPRDRFYEIAAAPSNVAPFTLERCEELMGVFDSIARDFSRAVLRYWDWEGNPRIAAIVRDLGLSADGSAAPRVGALTGASRKQGKSCASISRA